MTPSWRTAGTVAAAGLGLAGAGLYWLVRRPLARRSGAIHLPDLESQVEVFRDRRGVPHIYARTRSDLFQAQGFVHAQDRLWQMDFWRRLVSGRLAEVLGPVSLPTDRWLRILGLGRIARAEAESLDPTVRGHLEAYAAGVNARITQGRLPLEFSLLRYEPDPWSVSDCLLWGKLVGWSLSVNWETELLRARLIHALGPERAAELEPEFRPEWPVSLAPEILEASRLGGQALALADAARPYLGPSAPAGLGSNNWAVSPGRSASGHPLLANDMHLSMTAPAIWYENHLEADDYRVSGVTFPGQPGILAGHNGRVAWGFTNGFPDVQDLFIERLRSRADGSIEYEFQGQWQAVTQIAEAILVKGQGAVHETVLLTHHGPIINGLAPAEMAAPPHDDRPLALAWTGFQPRPHLARSIFRLNEARNCAEVYAALRDWEMPTQNVVYADTDGHIGHTFAGAVPVRARPSPLVPVPGWTGEHEWLGFIPFEALPHQLDPPAGFIATANHRVVDENYPYFIGRDYADAGRVRRIYQQLQARDKIDLAACRQLQFDTISLTALDDRPHLTAVRPVDPGLTELVERLRRWDGDMSIDSVAAAVYHVWTHELLHVLLDYRLDDLADRVIGLGPNPMLAGNSLFGLRAREWLGRVLAEPQSDWYDLGQGETRADCLELALVRATDTLTRLLGPDPDHWTWGRLHQITFAHPLGARPFLARIFNRGPFPIAGDSSTVHASGGNGYDLRLTQRIAAPFRFVADLGDLDHCQGLLAPGQSGQPGSPTYDDQVPAFFAADYHIMWFDRQDVEREARHCLLLSPAV